MPESTVTYWRPLGGEGAGQGCGAGAGLELPQLPAARGVEGDELARLPAGEEEVAAGRQHPGPDLEVRQRHAPLLFPGKRIDRLDVADRLPGRAGHRQVLD